MPATPARQRGVRLQGCAWPAPTNVTKATNCSSCTPRGDNLCHAVHRVGGFLADIYHKVKMTQ